MTAMISTSWSSQLLMMSPRSSRTCGPTSDAHTVSHAGPSDARWASPARIAGRVKALDVKPLLREGGDVTEQGSFRSFIEELEKSGAWQGGDSWPDPVPGRPETFTRIRELDAVVDAGACG